MFYIVYITDEIKLDMTKEEFDALLAMCDTLTEEPTVTSTGKLETFLII